MFGEYALYCGEKVVALVCNRPTVGENHGAGKALVGKRLRGGLRVPGRETEILVGADDGTTIVSPGSSDCAGQRAAVSKAQEGPRSKSSRLLRPGVAGRAEAEGIDADPSEAPSLAGMPMALSAPGPMTVTQRVLEPNDRSRRVSQNLREDAVLLADHVGAGKEQHARRRQRGRRPCS